MTSQNAMSEKKGVLFIGRFITMAVEAVLMLIAVFVALALGSRWLFTKSDRR